MKKTIVWSNFIPSREGVGGVLEYTHEWIR